MNYTVTHRTRYSSREPISIGHNKGWLEPRPLSGQQMDHFRLQIEPTPSVQSRIVDPFGNPVWMFSFNEGYSELSITATSSVSVQARVPPSQSPTCGEIRHRLRQQSSADDIAASEFRFESSAVDWIPDIQQWAAESLADERPIIDGVRELTDRFHRDFTYDSAATEIDTPVSQVFATRRGVCQDFAHLQMAMIRSTGLAARYISGYLRTYPPAGQPRLIGADASHAWLSVYCGGDGWIDVDPTNNVFPGDEHITLAWGRDYHDVPPLAGVCIGGRGHQLKVNVDVAPMS